MAGRAVNRILLIIVIFLCSLSSGFSERVQDREEVLSQSAKEIYLMGKVHADSMQSRTYSDRLNIRFQEAPESRIREIMGMFDPDFSLEISYNNRNLKESFLVNNSILSERGFGDQFLYSIDISPSVIFSDRFILEFTYSSIPDQRNFPNTTVLNFEKERVILNEVNRYNGHALAISSAYSLPITEGIRAAFHLGVVRMRLNVDETLQYHPDDPFVRNYSIVTLPFKKREITYSNPFVGLSAEFQLQSIRLTTGYQLQLYGFDEVSSSNFYISLGVRFSDLF